MLYVFSVFFYINNLFAMSGGFEVKPNDPLLSSFVGIVISNLDNNTHGACTGTIIGRRTVLTAAHCFKNIRDGKNFRITISNTNRPFASIDQNPQIKRVVSTRFSIYPKYLTASDASELVSYDVGIIHLDDSEFSENQKPLPIIFAGALVSFPSALQVYSVGDSGVQDIKFADTPFKKENFSVLPFENFNFSDPLKLFSGVNGGFFLIDHPQAESLNGDSGSATLANRYGVPTIVGVLSGDFFSNDIRVGTAITNLNAREINSWIRSQIR